MSALPEGKKLSVLTVHVVVWVPQTVGTWMTQGSPSLRGIKPWPSRPSKLHSSHNFQCTHPNSPPPTAQQPLVGQGTPRHTTLGATSLDDWSARHKRPLPDNRDKIPRQMRSQPVLVHKMHKIAASRKSEKATEVMTIAKIDAVTSRTV
jgi:hypothetical protein